MLKVCRKCGLYCISGTCRKCGSKAYVAHPPKFSFPDRYGEYRRKAKLKLKMI